MPARVIVYCRSSAANLSVESLREELADADLYTLAESLELPGGEEAAVDAMMPHLRIAGSLREGELVEVYWTPGRRPIQIRRIAGDRARGEIAETLDEQLPAAKTAGARRVREHLDRCIEIVAFELGVSDALDLAATVTEVLAFFVAEQCDGLVWFYHRDWAAPDDRGENLWVT